MIEDNMDLQAPYSTIEERLAFLEGRRAGVRYALELGAVIITIATIFLGTTIVTTINSVVESRVDKRVDGRLEDDINGLVGTAIIEQIEDAKKEAISTVEKAGVFVVGTAEHAAIKAEGAATNAKGSEEEAQESEKMAQGSAATAQVAEGTAVTAGLEAKEAENEVREAAKTVEAGETPEATTRKATS
jgi:hypothetical protein